MIGVYIGIDRAEATHSGWCIRTGYKERQVYNITAQRRKESFLAEGSKRVTGIDMCKVWRCPCWIVTVCADLNSFARCAEKGAARSRRFGGIEKICRQEIRRSQLIRNAIPIDLAIAGSSPPLK